MPTAVLLATALQLRLVFGDESPSTERRCAKHKSSKFCIQEIGFCVCGASDVGCFFSKGFVPNEPRHRIIVERHLHGQRLNVFVTAPNSTPAMQTCMSRASRPQGQLSAATLQGLTPARKKA